MLRLTPISQVLDRELALVSSVGVAAALLLRAVVAGHLGCISVDGVFYVEIATRHVSGDTVFDPIFPPLYPLLAAWTRGLASDPVAAGQWVSTAVGAIGALPVCLLGRLIFDRRTAVYATALYAAHPLLVLYGADVMTEAPYTALLAAAWVALFAWFRSPSRLAGACAGVLLGAAALLRPEAAAYAAAAPVAGLLLSRRKPQAGWTLMSAGLLIAAFCIVVAPYATYLHDVTGRWTLSGKTDIMLTKARAVGAENVGAAVDRRMRTGDRTAGVVGEILSSPVGFAARVATNVHVAHKEALPALLPPTLLAAVVLGLVRLRPDDHGQRLLLLLPLPYLPVLGFVVDPRVLLPLAPIALLWAGRGVSDLQDRMCGSPLLRKAAPFHPAAVVLVLSLLPFTLRPLYRTSDNAIYRRAGEWLRAHESPSRVAFQKPWVAFYAGAARSGLPATPFDAAIEELVESGVSHLAVDTRIVPAQRAEFMRLLDDQSPPPGLTPIHRLSDGLGQRVVLYRLGETE